MAENGALVLSSAYAPGLHATPKAPDPALARLLFWDTAHPQTHPCAHLLRVLAVDPLGGRSMTSTYVKLQTKARPPCLDFGLAGWISSSPAAAAKTCWWMESRVGEVR